MTKKEARRIALQVIASNINVVLNEVDLHRDEDGNVIRSIDEVKQIIIEMDTIADQLNKKALRLK